MKLQPLGTGQGFLKAGFLGFQGSGKTYTATLLACHVKLRFGLDGPIVFYDTEGGSTYVAPLVETLTGSELIGVRARSFDDLVEAHTEAQKIGAACFLADSVTHPWRELCDAHLMGVNEKRARKNMRPRTNLVMKDWSVLKSRWNDAWTTPYLNAPMHSIICGRAGYEYDHTEDEESGQKGIEKSGIKMKTEGEFGFEPSLLTFMERTQELDGNTPKVRRQAVVLKERFGAMDARVGAFDSLGDPVAEMEAVADFFAPHLDRLSPGAHAPVDNEIKSVTNSDAEGDSDWSREKKQRAIFCEEIQGELLSKWPGQTAKEKKAKADTIEAAFKTRSWTAIENMSSDQLSAGLDRIREALSKETAA